MTRPRRSSRREYDRISRGATDVREPLAPNNNNNNNNNNGNEEEPTTTMTSNSNNENFENNNNIPSISCPEEEAVTLSVLDPAQTKFRVLSDPDWTVAQFKIAGCAIHRVAPNSQRLIHMGRLLQDDCTLRECGLNEDDKIIHLFPKPNVVVSHGHNGDAGENGGGEEEDGATTGNDVENGAHVPQIVLDAEEAERRSQILILSSAEVYEAQHRVKLLSFLLLIISSMKLLTLFTIMVGASSVDGFEDDIPPGDPTETGGGGAGGGGASGGGNGVGGAGGDSGVDATELRTWRDSDYIDLVISAFGFYVATLGIKATTENTLALARRYFHCLVVVGISWNAFDYFLNVQLARASSTTDDDEEDDDGNVYVQALFAITLSVFVWFICFLRAWQFQRLISEAEEEAEERTRSLTANNNMPDGASGMSDDLAGGVEDLELQVEGRVNT